MLRRQKLGKLCRCDLKGGLLDAFRMQHPTLERHVELHPSFYLTLVSAYRGSVILSMRRIISGYCA